MRRGAILILACLLTFGCAALRSPSGGPWINPPLVEEPKLDLQRLPQPAALVIREPGSTTQVLDVSGVQVFSSTADEQIEDIAAIFTRRAWQEFSEWVRRTYEDGKVRFRVLDEANRR